MKLWISLALFTSATLLVTAFGRRGRGECDDGFFTSEIIITSNETYPLSIRENRFDFDLVFFREVMGFSDREIENAEAEALDFFATRYGLDFRAIKPNANNQRFLQNVTFFPFVVPINLTASSNRWLSNGRLTTSRCYVAREGGYAIDISADSEQQLLFGEYGGENGIPIFPGDTIAWGFYHISVCDQQPIVIRLSSNTPARSNRFDGIIIESNNVWHSELGEGIEQGVFTALPVPPDFAVARLVTRRFMTFPDHLP